MQAAFQFQCEIAGNAPVGACLFRRSNGCTHARNAPLGIGDRAFFFTPARSGQQYVGVGGGFGVVAGFLQHHQFGAGQRFTHGGLVGHRLRGIGAGDPYRLDFAATNGFEHFNGGFAGTTGDGRHAPQCCDFGAVSGVLQVAVANQQIRHRAGFTAAHRVGLAGQ